MKRCVIIVLSIMLSYPYLAFSVEKAVASSVFTPESISSFAVSLINSGEYHRAYVELQRLDSYYPGYIGDTCRDITMNYILIKSGQYEDILKGYSRNFNRTDCWPPLFAIDSMIKLGRIDEALAETAISLDRCATGDFSVYLRKRYLYLSLLKNEVNYNKTWIPEGQDYGELLRSSKQVYADMKSPGFAVFAGIIPGMGYMYAGESGTGIISMIVIGTGSAVTYIAHENRSDALAVITGIITFFFYSGSILGGYMQTVKGNDILLDSFKYRLDRDISPQKDIDEIYLKFGISSNAGK